MGNIERKPVIGILGGIASGKSTVAAEFAKLGCKVIDADKIVHSLLERKSVREEISASFGRAVLDATGKNDHKKLARTVFAGADKLSILNGIIHPLVLERAEQLMEQYSHQDQVRAIVLDMPLLVEVGWVERCDKLVFVACREDLRADRAEKMGFDKNQLKIRENFQISLDNKVDLADNTVENNSDLSALVRQIADIFSDIMDNG